MIACYWNVTGCVDVSNDDNVVEYLTRYKGFNDDDIWINKINEESWEVSLRIECRSNRDAEQIFYEALDPWMVFDVTAEPD